MPPRNDQDPTDPSFPSLDECLAQAERTHLLAALRQADGKKRQAARLLGISRQTLYNKLERHGLHEPTGRAR